MSEPLSSTSQDLAYTPDKWRQAMLAKATPMPAVEDTVIDDLTDHEADAFLDAIVHA